MTKADRTKKMKSALKEIVMPVLRKKGFVGSLPHLRRVTDAKVELLSFQFSYLSQGAFVVIAGCASKDGYTDFAGNFTPVNKLKGWFCNPKHLGSTFGENPWMEYALEPFAQMEYHPAEIDAQLARNNIPPENHAFAHKSHQHQVAQNKQILEKGEHIYEHLAQKVLTLLPEAQEYWDSFSFDESE